MGLPAHLARYGALVDLIVERLVGELAQGAGVKTPAGIHGPADVRISTSTTNHKHYEYPTAGESAATE